MTVKQLRVTAVLADMILPEDATSPSASAVGVPDFIDEWVSAPYEAQQNDRSIVLDGLLWIEQQSLDRFGVSFVAAEPAQHAEILDDIAYAERIEPGDEAATAFFARLRFLVIGAYYTTQEGIDDIGYLGNQPIAGEYPGPTPEAMAHLRAALANLGLDLPQV